MSGKSLPVAFIVALALVGFDEIRHQGHTPPYPQRFVTVGFAFGLLGVLDTVAPPVAAILGWGFVLALAYKAAGAQQAATDTTGITTAPAVTNTAATIVTL